MTLRMFETTVRTINSHVWGGVGSCYVDTVDGRRFRVSRVRTRKGVIEGRVITGNLHNLRDWEPIPVSSTVELQ